MMNEKCENCIFRDQCFFGPHAENIIAEINQCKIVTKYKKGKNIFFENSPSSKVFCVQTGKVKVVTKLNDGREMIVSIDQCGDLIGIFDLFNDKYTFSAYAIEETQLCQIDKPTLINLAKNSSSLSLSIMNKMSKEKHIIDVRFSSLVQKNVRERLAHLILILSVKFGVNDSRKIRLTVKLTREEMASMIGTVTETVIRLMTELKDEGLIEEEKKIIYILDIERLKKFSGLRRGHECSLDN